jgi:hypothetical protein
MAFGKDMIGFEIGRIKVIERDFSRKGWYWRYECSCGTTSTASGGDLRAGAVKSCGCGRKGTHWISKNRGKTYPEIGRAPSPLAGKTYAELGRRLAPLKNVPQKEEFVEKRRVAIIKVIAEGKFSPQNSYNKARSKTIQTIKGGTVICHSSWEEVYARHLDSDDDVVSYQKDKLRIPYLKDGEERIYITDYLIEFSSGKRKLVEIKPKEMLEEDDNLLKIEAGKLWCSRNDISFSLVLGEEIKKLNGGKIPLSFNEQRKAQEKQYERLTQSFDEQMMGW